MQVKEGTQIKEMESLWRNEVSNSEWRWLKKLNLENVYALEMQEIAFLESKNCIFVILINSFFKSVI